MRLVGLLLTFTVVWSRIGTALPVPQGPPTESEHGVKQAPAQSEMDWSLPWKSWGIITLGGAVALWRERAGYRRGYGKGSQDGVMRGRLDGYKKGLKHGKTKGEKGVEKKRVDTRVYECIGLWRFLEFEPGEENMSKYTAIVARCTRDPEEFLKMADQELRRRMAQPPPPPPETNQDSPNEPMQFSLDGAKKKITNKLSNMGNIFSRVSAGGGGGGHGSNPSSDSKTSPSPPGVGRAMPAPKFVH